MKSILAIAKYTILEQIRNRLYLIIMFFGALVLGLSLLLGALAPGYKTRVIFDFGLVTLEMFGLITGVFGAVTLVIQEIETKTIYLLLTRPLGRPLYILGRFLGLFTTIALVMISMGLIHLGIMLMDMEWFQRFTAGWDFWSVYPALVLMSIGKMLVISAIAIFFSLFATSSVSALVFTVFFWISGHFNSELSFMVNKTFVGMPQKVVSFFSHVFPNFQYFNFRDTFQVPQFPGYEFMSWSLMYGVAYAGFFLILSSLLFARKEF